MIVRLGLSLLSGGGDSRKDFSRLSEILLPGMTGEAEIEPSFSENLLESKRREADLQRIAAGNGELGKIAQQIFKQRQVAHGIASDGAAALGTVVRGGIENSMSDGKKRANGPSSGDAKVLQGLVGVLKQGFSAVELFADMQSRFAAMAELAPRYSPRQLEDFDIDMVSPNRSPAHSRNSWARFTPTPESNGFG